MTENPDVTTPDVGLRWCNQCDEAVPPVGKGQCPKCGGFVAGNSVKAKENRDRQRAGRVQDIERAFADVYKVHTETDRLRVAALASSFERLERLKPGSLEFMRLTNAIANLEAGLSQTRQPEPGIYITNAVLDASRTSLERKFEVILWRLVGPPVEGKH